MIKANGRNKRISIIIISAFLLILLCSYFIDPRKGIDNVVDRWYAKQLDSLEQAVVSIQRECSRKRAAGVKDNFIKARFAYKKLSPLTDYFNAYETKQLNGPAIKRTEEDNPHDIIDPHGFQVIEELIFTKDDSLAYNEIENEAASLLSVIHELENEPDRIYKFQNALVWDALRASLLRMATLGITGFDSPVAKLSMQESAAVLEGIGEIMSLLESNRDISFQVLQAALDNAKNYLLAHKDFDIFDRLYFITNHINPLYSKVVQTRMQLNCAMPAERRPLQVDDTSFFNQRSFNLDFFSPNSRYQATRERIALGKRLFYDPVLSANNKRSCASCHVPQKAFTDGLKAPAHISKNVSLTRNTPTLWNTVLQTSFFYDSRANTLENQLSTVVHSESEMQGSLQQLGPELKRHKTYAPLFQQAYPEDKDPFSQYNIANAISSYIRSLVALNSRFDQYMQGQKDQLTADEKTGFNLFMGKGKCGTCHFMPLFNGLVPPEFNETESEVLGVPKTKDKKKPVLDEDPGKYGFTKSIVHKFSFKTPTLRNVALTAPYMHNGVFTTLEEVMDFYNQGGGNGLGIAPETQTLPAEPLGLSEKESKQIIQFMKTLTDTSQRILRGSF